MCWFVRAGATWRLTPHDLPPWHTVYQQTQRWLAADVFGVLVPDLRMLRRELAGRAPQPTAAVLDGRTLQSSPESGGWAGYDGHKKGRGARVHLAVDTLGHVLALVATPANEQAERPVPRAPVGLGRAQPRRQLRDGAAREGEQAGEDQRHAALVGPLPLEAPHVGLQQPQQGREERRAVGRPGRRSDAPPSGGSPATVADVKHPHL